MRAAGTTPGAMAAVAAPAEQVRKLLGHAPAVTVANDNSPVQCVISGPAAGVSGAEQALGRAGISCKRLAVSTAFHSALVEPVVAPLLDFLNGLSVRAPRVPVYSNTTARPYPGEESLLRRHLARQLAEPVRFRQTIEDMYRRGVRTFLEVGPGSVLTGLAGDCLKGLPHVAVSLDRKGRHGVLSLWHALARLAVQGVPIRWDAIWKDFAPVSPAPPAQPSRPVVMISGTNMRPSVPAAEKPAPIPTPVPVEQTMNGLSHASTNGKCHAAAPALVPEPAFPASPPPTPVRRRPQNEWVAALREVLRETAAVQQSYQQVMAESCKQFFESMERSIQEVVGALGGRQRKRRKKRRALPAPDAAVAEPTRPASLPSEPEPAAEADMGPRSAEPSFTLAETNGQEGRFARLPDTPREVPVIKAAPPAPPRTTAPAGLRDLVLGVVAEKTGYPAEMLTLDMEIEAGLGIDSIKRVEILSALEQRVPGLAGIDPGLMFSLRTLGDVVDIIHNRQPAEAPFSPTSHSTSAAFHPPAPAVLAPATGAAPPPAREEREAAGLRDVVLGVVAEKTGYPAEMLTLDMEIEAGLGIDSIKRVEILSALEQRVPGLAGIDPGLMFSLRTLGDVVDAVRGGPSFLAT